MTGGRSKDGLVHWGIAGLVCSSVAGLVHSGLDGKSLASAKVPKVYKGLARTTSLARTPSLVTSR